MCHDPGPQLAEDKCPIKIRPVIHALPCSSLGKGSLVFLVGCIAVAQESQACAWRCFVLMNEQPEQKVASCQHSLFIYLCVCPCLLWNKQKCAGRCLRKARLGSPDDFLSVFRASLPLQCIRPSNTGLSRDEIVLCSVLGMGMEAAAMSGGRQLEREHGDSTP